MLELRIDTRDEEVRQILIAKLAEIGYESFEETQDTLNAYIPVEKFSEAELEETIQLFHLKYSKEQIAQRNWNEEWEKNFQPVVIDDFCTVRASFHEKNPETKFDIVITPKMSFGTGHHATTYMMLDLMRGISFHEKTVFDFGTGTGILAILAEKLGAKNVLAIDIDEWSIVNARENLLLNECEKIALEQTGNIQSSQSFDIMLANINRNVILESLPQIVPILKADGEVLLSGLLKEDFEVVDEKLREFGMIISERREKNGWIAIKYHFS